MELCNTLKDLRLFYEHRHVIKFLTSVGLPQLIQFSKQGYFGRN